MKNGANSPFIVGGSSPPENCSTNISHDNNELNWMTAAEAAVYLRCTIKTLYNYKCNGKLIGYNRGGTKKGQLLFNKSELDLFVTSKGGRYGQNRK